MSNKRATILAREIFLQKFFVMFFTNICSIFMNYPINDKRVHLYPVTLVAIFPGYSRRDCGEILSPVSLTSLLSGEKKTDPSYLVYCRTHFTNFHVPKTLKSTKHLS